MNLIPWPYRWLAVAALAAVLIGFGWIKGAGHVQAQWDAAVQKQTLQAAAVRERQAQAAADWLLSRMAIEAAPELEEAA